MSDPEEKTIKVKFVVRTKMHGTPEPAISDAPYAFRPIQWVFVALVAMLAVFLLLIAAAAWRNGQASIFWLGAGLAILSLSVCDFYRCRWTITTDAIEERRFQLVKRLPFREIKGYGIRKAVGTNGTTNWLCIEGQNGMRIDVPFTFVATTHLRYLQAALRQRAPQAVALQPKPPRTPGLLLLGTLTIVVLLFSSMLLYAFSEKILNDGLLLNLTAAIGVLAGVLSGVGLGRRLLPQTPAAALTALTLVGMTLLPAAAFFADYVLAVRPGQTMRARVVSRTSYMQHNKTHYLVTLQLAESRKELSLRRETWEHLHQGEELPVCVNDGGLGFRVVTRYGRPCGLSR